MVGLESKMAYLRVSNIEGFVSLGSPSRLGQFQQVPCSGVGEVTR